MVKMKMILIYFSKQFRHYVKSITATLVLSTVTQEQLKKFFLQLASFQWEKKLIMGFFSRIFLYFIHKG